MNSIKMIFTIAVTALVSACGGGGSDGAGVNVVSSPETFQLRTAYSNYLTNSETKPYSIVGTINGTSVSGSGTLTQGSLSSATFNSKPALAKTTTITGSVTVNGQKIPLNASATEYVDSNYTPVGSSGEEYVVVTGPVNIPPTAKVSDTAVWYTATRYSSSSKSTVNGTLSVSYVMEPDTATTALVTIISTKKNSSQTTTSTSTITLRITPSGALTRVKETQTEGASSLTINY